MKAPLLIVAAILGLSAALTACGDAEEELAPQPSATTAAASTTQPPTAQPTTPSPTPEPSPEGIPADWKTYIDPVLRFSLRYPPDLVARDLTEGGFVRGQRAIDFRSPTDASRAFAISVSENTEGLALEQWAVEEAACIPKTIQQGALASLPALTCTREVIEGQPEASMLAEKEGRVFLLSAIGFSNSEFVQLIGSFGF